MKWAAGNSNRASIAADAFKVARNAGGRTWAELQHILPRTENVSDNHWLDPVTDLWIPNGMAPLHRKVSKRDRLDISRE